MQVLRTEDEAHQFLSNVARILGELGAKLDEMTATGERLSEKGLLAVADPKVQMDKLKELLAEMKQASQK